MSDPFSPDDGGEAIRMLLAVSADVRASLAISRTTLQALASLSPALHEAVDDALNEEAAQAARLEPQTAKRVQAILRSTQEQLRQAETETQMAGEMEKALQDAAAALPLGAFKASKHKR